MNIGPYGFDEYLDRVKDFHGTVAPGMIAGGIMVDLAQKALPEGKLYDVICETRHCLVDAVQLLTPCTIGNGWLKLIETGRFALTMYDKYEGVGLRVFVDVTKLDRWPGIRSWFMKERPKDQQDMDSIISEFRQSGSGFCGHEPVQVEPELRADHRGHRPGIVICNLCGEAFRGNGEICPSCAGTAHYYTVP